MQILALEETFNAWATRAWVRPCAVMCSSSRCTSCACSVEEAAEALGVAGEEEAAEAAASGTGASSRYAAISASVSASVAVDSLPPFVRPSHMQSVLGLESPTAETTCPWVRPCAAMCSSSRCTSCACLEEKQGVAAEALGVAAEEEAAEAAASKTGASSRYAAISASVSAAATIDSLLSFA